MFRISPVFLALFGVPLIEIGLFAYVGGRVGVWWTIGLVLITAAVGTALLMQQGTATMARAREVLAAGGIPAREMIDGVLLLASGLLLLTPGFLTDAFGFLLVLPPSRAIMRGMILRRIQGKLTGEGMRRPASSVEVVDDEGEPPPPPTQ